MTDGNPRNTPIRGVSLVSDDSGYNSTLPSPGGMFDVSTCFKGKCKTKVHENFGYLKHKVNPIPALEELQAFYDDFITDEAAEQLKESKRHKQADKLIKRVLRKGEAHCKLFLKSFNSDTIQSSFVLDHLNRQFDKTNFPTTSLNIDIQDLHDNHQRLCEEIENDRILDPLLEYYLLSYDDHDRVVYNCKTRGDKNSLVLSILCTRTSGDWVNGFVCVLESNGHSILLRDIQHRGRRIVPRLPFWQIFDSAWEMSIKVNGLHSARIELQLARHSELDDLCRKFANLEISNIRHGSVLLMVHPIVPDKWRKASRDEKEAVLQKFIRELLDKPDIKDLIQREITVTIEVKEIKNVFGDPAWRVKEEKSLSPDQQCMEDNWTYLAEELEVNRLMDELESKQYMTKEEKDIISNIEGRRERAYSFLKWYWEKLPTLKIKTLIQCLEATGQKHVAQRLQNKRLCPDCLLETYKDPDNYKILLDEMVSSMMEQTVGRFDEIPHHICNILTPDCGKSRRDRAQLFMQYVLLNDEVLKSFENTLASMGFDLLDAKQCDSCQPKGRTGMFGISLGLVEDTDSIRCVLNVTKERDRSLTIELSKSTKGGSAKNIEMDQLLEPLLSSTPTRAKYPRDPISHRERPPVRVASESVLKTKKDFSATVVAIDFGTTYSGFAFSLKKEKAEIYTKKWNNPSGKGQESEKTPTTILLNANKEFEAFGYEAEDRYEQLCNNNEHTKHYYFRHFKMRLHTSKGLTRSTVIEDILGNTIPALEVFSMAITYLKREAEKALMEHGFNKDNVSWVLTVPAIWDDPAKQFMREAAEQAFIPTRRLTIALEPEVASVYIGCQRFDKSRATFAQEPQLRFLVVDIGGGTADLTVMETAEEGKLKQISIASGGPCGGEEINNGLLSRIKSLVGADIVDYFRQNHTCEYNQLLSDIEFAKRTWRKGKSTLKLTLPACFIECFESTTNKSFEKHIIETSKGVSFKKSNRLVFNPDVAYEVINSVIDKIIGHSKEILEKSKNVSYMVIVGGFAENDVLQERLKKEFRDLTIIIPPQAGLAVLKGAVLYGHDPSCVKMRRCDRTYGTQVYRLFLEGVDHDDKLVNKHGQFYCKDVFNSLAEIGESIEIDETRSTEMSPLHKGMTAMSIKLYGSTEKSPKYVTDPSCTLLGKIVVDIPEDWRTEDERVIVSMTFGQTEITVEGRSEHSQKRVETKLDFLRE